MISLCNVLNLKMYDTDLALWITKRSTKKVQIILIGKWSPPLSVSVWGGVGMYWRTDLKQESVLSSAESKTTTSTIVYFSFVRPLRNIACFELWEIPQDLCEIPLPNQGSPSSSDGKGSASNTGDPGSIPGSGRSPREGNGNPFQYPWTEEPGGLQFMVVAKSRTRLRLTHAHTHTQTRTSMVHMDEKGRDGASF